VSIIANTATATLRQLVAFIFETRIAGNVDTAQTEGQQQADKATNLKNDAYYLFKVGSFHSGFVCVTQR
jgi:hypothetical protein